MRAIKITAFILCISLSMGVLSGIGWFGWVGVHPDPGIENEGVVEEQANEVGAAGEGGQDDGMLGLVSGALDVINALRTLTVQSGSALMNLGIPAPIARAVQIIVTFTVLLAMVQIVRGMNFR